MNQRQAERFGRGVCLALLLLAPAPALAAPPNAAQIRASAERLAAWAVETRRPEILARAIDTLLAHGATLEPADPWGAADLLGALGGMRGGVRLATAINRPTPATGRQEEGAAGGPRDNGASQMQRRTRSNALGDASSGVEMIMCAHRGCAGIMAEGKNPGVQVESGPASDPPMFPIAAPAPRGVTIGVTRAELTLAPGARASFDLLFQAQEPAIVEARLKRGSEGADVDLRVIDAAGSVLAADLGPDSGRPGYGLYVEWRPETCVATRVELANAGSGDAHLVMLTQPSSRPQCEE